MLLFIFISYRHHYDTVFVVRVFFITEITEVTKDRK